MTRGPAFQTGTKQVCNTCDVNHWTGMGAHPKTWDSHRWPTYAQHNWSRSQQSSMPKQQWRELRSGNALKSKTAVGPLLIEEEWSEGEVVTAEMWCNVPFREERSSGRRVGPFPPHLSPILMYNGFLFFNRFCRRLNLFFFEGTKHADQATPREQNSFLLVTVPVAVTLIMYGGNKTKDPLDGWTRKNRKLLTTVTDETKINENTNC